MTTWYTYTELAAKYPALAKFIAINADDSTYASKYPDHVPDQYAVVNLLLGLLTDDQKQTMASMLGDQHEDDIAKAIGVDVGVVVRIDRACLNLSGL